MKALSYNRKAQYSNDTESYIGLYSKTNKLYKHTIINPIIDGYLNKGVCHTNAFNITEIEIETPKDLATGKLLKVDFDMKPIVDLMDNAIKNLNKIPKPIINKREDCEECEGTGKDFYSCCGDDMRGNDYGICPSCKEHWELGECDFCN